MTLPPAVEWILSRLAAGGYSAHVVGGCVRDTFLGRTPGDWDICTSALPEETEACFPKIPVLKTGQKHGTVTVVLDHQPFEVTTYRRDGTYADHRRPDEVQFVTALEEDLARRDFTVNAMAYSPGDGLTDLFGGQRDLAARVIRCVGDPEKRFTEDALRILRALRFSAQLSFSIDPDTARAARNQAETLQFVSRERVFAELCKLLLGPGVGPVLQNNPDILAAVIPEIAPCVGFLQHHPTHDRDVWGHTAAAVAAAKADRYVRWALLLHDIGKPQCFTLDGAGVGHFYGHGAVSAELSRTILKRLRADNRTVETVCLLVSRHDSQLEATRRSVRRWVGRMGGEENFWRLMEVRRCDGLAHADSPETRASGASFQAFCALARQVLQEERCFTVQDLAVSGRDVIAAGIPTGPEVGLALRVLLEDVTEERCSNEREALLRRLEAWKQERLG